MIPLETATRSLLLYRREKLDHHPIRLLLYAGISKTHSEQGVYVFLKPKLTALKLDTQQVAARDVVIFSHVKVCTSCSQTMVSWQAVICPTVYGQNCTMVHRPTKPP